MAADIYRQIMYASEKKTNQQHYGGNPMTIFKAADVLLPENTEMEKWAVIACDQFTSEPEYWQEAASCAGDGPSALHLILPEAYLDHTDTGEIDTIHRTMERYLKDGVFDVLPDSYVYVERTLANGTIRRGLVGIVDLEQYDFRPDSTSLVRATEFTVPERIPPRLKIRENASLELPHVLMLCDDAEDKVLGCCEKMKDELPLLYDFDLMLGGGHVTGRLVQNGHREKLDAVIAEYEKETRQRYLDRYGKEIAYSVGDGNHSLATARTHYLKKREEGAGDDDPCRYAMVELGNLHDDSLVFEPIHRLVITDVKSLLAKLVQENADGTYPVPYITASGNGEVMLSLAEGELPLARLQKLLDEWLEDNEGEIDYIHGEKTLQKLVNAENRIGFLLPPIAKDELFSDILTNGVLPRKTFSMGHASEKRYYIESRKIV